MLLLSAVTSSINTIGVVPVTAMHAHAIACLTCLTDDAVCFRSRAALRLQIFLFPSLWYKLISVSTLQIIFSRAVQCLFKCFLTKSNLTFFFLIVPNGCFFLAVIHLPPWECSRLSREVVFPDIILYQALKLFSVVFHAFAFCWAGHCIYEIDDKATPELSATSLISLCWFFSLIWPPSVTPVYLWISYWEFQWLCKINTWNQLHIFYILNLSWDNKGPGLTWPCNSLSTFQLLYLKIGDGV